jgi:hypothetical protein
MEAILAEPLCQRRKNQVRRREELLCSPKNSGNSVNFQWYTHGMNNCCVYGLHCLFFLFHDIISDFKTLFAIPLIKAENRIRLAEFCHGCNNRIKKRVLFRTIRVIKGDGCCYHCLVNWRQQDIARTTVLYNLSG